MRAIVFKAACEAKDLRVTEDNEKPKIKDDEVLVQVHAFGVNFADIIARKGQYDAAPPFPFIPGRITLCTLNPGYEASGIVTEVGSAVTKRKVGDKVMGLVDFGGYAEYVRMKEIVAFPLPEDWSFAQGAAIMVVYVTAYHAIFHTGTLFEGDTVLIHSAAGGLGLASMELALHKKCRVIGVCSSESKCELVREKGGEAINSSRHEYTEEVKRLTNNKGVDVILDPVGGKNFKKDVTVLSANGRVVGLGGAFSTDRSFSNMFSLIPGVLSMLTLLAVELMLQCKSFCGVNLKVLADEKPHVVELAVKGFLQLFSDGVLETPHPHEFPWEDIGKVHADMEGRKTSGKLVMIINHEHQKGKEEKE